MAERTSKSASSSNFAPDRLILRSVRPKIVKFYFFVCVNSLGHQLAISLGHQLAISLGHQLAISLSHQLAISHGHQLAIIPRGMIAYPSASSSPILSPSMKHRGIQICLILFAKLAHVL